MANEVREQTKGLRSLASPRTKWNLLKKPGTQCTEGGHPAALSGEVHFELFSHLGISDSGQGMPQGTDSF